MATLSPLTIPKIQPKAKRFEVADNVVSGLYLVVQPSGSKSWAVRTRINRKPVKITLGPLEEPIELKAVRDRARATLESAQSGPGPVVAPPVLALPAPLLALPAPAADTVASVWGDYLSKQLEPTAKAGTVKRFRGLFEKHILPTWRDRPIKSIVKRDCLGMIDAAQTRGAEARNSTIVVLSSFFVWALGRDIIDALPIAGIKKTNEAGRTRFLTDAEIKTFWAGCDKLGPIFGPMFQLMLLTGVRRSGVSGMRYDELDLEKRTWLVPAARMKGRKAKAVPLLVHLTEAMVSALATLPRITSDRVTIEKDGQTVLSPFVFTTSGTAPSSGFSKAKFLLDKLAPISGDYVLHDLRRTFVTGSNRLGANPDHVERCVGHSVGAMPGRYNLYDYLDEKKAVWELWSKHVENLVDQTD
jgi:integrase